MNQIRKVVNNVKEYVAEYYTLAVIVLILPAIIGSIVGFSWGLLLSFALQAIIGLFYIKGDVK